MSRKEEIQAKLEKLRICIELEGLSGIYCKRQDTFAWLTSGGQNYVGLGELGNCGLLVTSDGAYAITNSIEEARMREEEYLELLGFEILSGPWHDRDFEKVTLARLCSLATLALDYSAGFGRNLQAKLIEMRSSLSGEELVRYRKLGLAASAILEEVASCIRVGDTEKSVVGRVSKLLYDQGMDFASMMCAS
ncbi:MAG: aminopeptidase P family N-terminal domain-containing protein, partial [Firmicutes bacterium]|nr:aminopeptidase P family N-terminal domain-containing protein [Bacillota bacterium]